MPRALLWSFLLVCAVAPAAADGPETGIVSGSVTDAGGAALPGIDVRIANDRGEKFTQTAQDGTFRFALLVPGAYVVKAELEGLGAAEQAVEVTAGGRADVELELKLETAETITVASKAPMIDKFNVGAGTTMPSEVGVQVTGENRSYYGVINFMPGVTNDAENVDLSSARPNINGATWADSTVYIDGVDTTVSRNGGTRVFLATSTMIEVSLESGGLTADYGRTVGSAANVIVKSGTNTFHGDALLQATEERWNSEYDLHPELETLVFVPARQPRDFFVRTPEEKENDDRGYEISLGGPLERDVAWFFVSAAQGSTNQSAKTLNGDFFDESGHAEARIAKFNLQPTASQSASIMYLDTPVTRTFALADILYDRYTVAPHDFSGTLYTAGYNVSLSPTLFFEAKLADQTSNENKQLGVGGLDIDEAIRIKQQDPRFPGSPDGGPDVPGNNSGGGNNQFDPTSPSGYVNALVYPDFTNPLGAACDFGFESCIRFDYNHPLLVADKGTNDTRSENVAVYARDRFTLGEHWTFNAGVRAERQRHRNDIDREVMDSTDVSPRLSAAYDIAGDGRRLVTAFAGRSYHQLPQEAIYAYLQDQFNGYNGYELTLFLDCAFAPCVEDDPDLHFPFPLGYVFSLGFVLPGFMWDLVDSGVSTPISSPTTRTRRSSVTSGSSRATGRSTRRPSGGRQITRLYSGYENCDLCARRRVRGGRSTREAARKVQEPALHCRAGRVFDPARSRHRDQASERSVGFRFRADG
jgi:hypothetical protein